MKINIVAVGKLKEKYWVDAIKEYAKRLSRFCKLEIIEIAEGKNLEAEGKEIIKKLKGYVFIFDINGTMVSSNDIAEKFENKLISGISEFSFVIGSSNGLSKEVDEYGDEKLSFGKITYPHQLMRVIAVEQIYRAMTINNNITYHK